MEQSVLDIKSKVNSLFDIISSKVIGKRKEIELVIATLLAEGHVLLEGVPGVAKTHMAKTISLTLGLSFKRIQSTPDMLPSDIVGSIVFDTKKGEFVFRQGPIFTNVLFVDEINRLPPKTQAALLEAMQELQVTVEGVTYPLPRPFLVIATMNPIEIEGTFPLSEAQVDRFLSKITLGYPSSDEMVEILSRFYEINDLMDIKPVMQIHDIIESIGLVKKVYVEQNIARYIAYIVEATRKHPLVKLGASPRGAIALYKLSKSMAFLRGRDYVTPDDVKYVVHAALSHRIILKPEARISGISPLDILDEVLEKVEVP
ncbi:MAG: MoxR family ATPase [Desulfurococcaceae archaeon]